MLPILEDHEQKTAVKSQNYFLLRLDRPFKKSDLFFNKIRFLRSFTFQEVEFFPLCSRAIRQARVHSFKAFFYQDQFFLYNIKHIILIFVLDVHICMSVFNIIPPLFILLLFCATFRMFPFSMNFC